MANHCMRSKISVDGPQQSKTRHQAFQNIEAQLKDHFQRINVDLQYSFPQSTDSHQAPDQSNVQYLNSMDSKIAQKVCYSRESSTQNKESKNEVQTTKMALDDSSTSSFTSSKRLFSSLSGLRPSPKKDAAYSD